MKRFLVEDDIIDNEKVFSLPAEDFRAWILCLCVANRMDPRGTLPAVGGIAFRMRMTEADAAAMVDRLIGYRLIDRTRTGALKIHDWDKHQAKERDWAAIKAAQRAKARAAQEAVHVDNSKCPRGRPRGRPLDVHRVSTSKEVILPSEVFSSSSDTQASRDSPLYPPASGGRKKRGSYLNRYPERTPEDIAAMEPGTNGQHNSV